MISCEKENCGDTEKEFHLTAEYLKQTIWKGKIWYEHMGETVSEGYINIQFTTDKRGQYEYKFNEEAYRSVEPFEYQIDDKLFVFKHYPGGPSATFEGDWLIKIQDKSAIVMVSDGFGENSVSKHIKVQLVAL